MCDKLSTADYSPPWSRIEPKYIEPSESIRQQTQMQKKGDVLQYNNNKFKLTKTQTYAQIAKGINLYRRKSFVTQTETYTNPNFNNTICGTTKSCFTTDKSDVPGPIIPLCYDSSLPNTLSITRLFEIKSLFQSPTLTNINYLYDEINEQNIVSFDVNYDDSDEKDIFLYVEENDGSTRKINIYGRSNISIPVINTSSCCVIIDNGKTSKLSSDITFIDQPPFINIIENNNNVLTCEIEPFINIHCLKTYNIDNVLYNINNDGYDDNIFNIKIDNTNDKYILSANFNNELCTLFKSYPITINLTIVLKINSLTLVDSSNNSSVKTYIAELSYYVPTISTKEPMYSNMCLMYKYTSSDQWNTMQLSQNNKTIKITGIAKDTEFYLQYVDNNILSKSNILCVKLTPPILSFISYIDGKLKLNADYSGSNNLLYKNYIPISDTADINSLIIDASKGDTFSYGIKPSLLSDVIKIPVSPRVKFNNFVHYKSNNTYNINFVVYYDDNIIENKTEFIISDIKGNIIQTISNIKRMQFLTIQTKTRSILKIRTRINYDNSYIDSDDIKIVK